MVKRKLPSEALKAAKKPKLAVPTEPVGHATRSKSRSKSQEPPTAVNPDTAIARGPAGNAKDRANGKAERSKDGMWEIPDGESRDALRVGYPAPHRLILRLREVATGEIKTSTYRTQAEEIDWNDADVIKNINQWRNQYFGRKDFAPKRAVNGWAAVEEAYLNLLYAKFKSAAVADKNLSVPHLSRVVRAFGEFFKHPDNKYDGNEEELPDRVASSITSYIRRPKGLCKPILDEFKDRPTDESQNAWLPVITKSEIEAYLKGKAINNNETTQPVPSIQPRKNTNAASAAFKKKTAKPKPTTKPSASHEQSSKLTDDQDVHNVNEDEDITDAPPRDTTEAMEPEPTTPPMLPLTERHPNLSPMISDPTKSRAHTSPGLGLQTPAPSPLQRTTLPVISTPPQDEVHQSIIQRATQQSAQLPTRSAPGKPNGRPRWVKPPETAVVPTHPEIVEKIKSTPGMEYSVIPENNEAAIKKHLDDYNKRQEGQKHLADDWNQQAIINVDQRLEKWKGFPAWEHVYWYRDFVPGSTSGEDAHTTTMREPGAAAVNGLLSATPIPPLGYGGDVRDLVRKRQLPEDELILHESSEDAIKRVHKKHDDDWAKAHPNDTGPVIVSESTDDNEVIYEGDFVG